MNKPAFAVWLTGLPGAGKSVISEELRKRLEEKHINVYLLRMDNMRNYVTPEPKYTDDERQLIYNAFSFTTKLLVENGVNVIMDATGNLRKYRKLAKKIIPNYLEIFIKCPLKLAIKREVKRKDTKEAPEEIYEKALQDEAENVPGLQAEYEQPKHPDVIVQSDKLDIQESAAKIFEEVQNRFEFIRKKIS
ncbi:MAG: putative adenylyl-sulfate kinase [Promethearchaeota archaeon]|nr:MAG: putative adenylyl-sulfate kinase [Candidatus Lokiarchaeota archaeon]